MSTNAPADLPLELDRIEQQASQCTCKTVLELRIRSLRALCEREPWRLPVTRARSLELQKDPSSKAFREMYQEVLRCANNHEELIAGYLVVMSCSVYTCGTIRKWHISLSRQPAGRCMTTRDLAVQRWIMIAAEASPDAKVYPGTRSRDIVHIDWEELPS